jgi:hypothetical protein
MYNLPVEYSKLSPKSRAEVRAQYVREQSNLCYWCKAPLTSDPASSIKRYSINWRLFPPSFLKHPIHLQHNHSTDLTEGAVHALCNAVMWQYYGR